MLASGESFQVVQNVAELASDLRAGAASVASSVTSTPVPGLPTSSPSAASSPAATEQVDATATLTPAGESTHAAGPQEPSPTLPAFDTPTPRPTRTAIPTAGAPFQLVSQDQVCNANLTEGLMQISVLDRHRHQMPGVEIDISSSDGEEAFFTGLKPEIADGYADYIMRAGIVYSLRVGRSGDAIADLAAPSCPDSSGETFLGGLKLVFQQP